MKKSSQAFNSIKVIKSIKLKLLIYFVKTKIKNTVCKFSMQQGIHAHGQHLELQKIFYSKLFYFRDQRDCIDVFLNPPSIKRIKWKVFNYDNQLHYFHNMSLVQRDHNVKMRNLDTWFILDVNQNLNPKLSSLY